MQVFCEMENTHVAQNWWNLSYLIRQRQKHQKIVQRFSLQKFVHLKFFLTLLKIMYCHDPCSLKPCISRPYSSGVFTLTKNFIVCVDIFSDAIICDCQTVNVISIRGGAGTYQRLGYVNGRTSWNSSTYSTLGYAVWYSQNYQGWLFGHMYSLGQDALNAFLKTSAGNDSCPYNISADQWQSCCSIHSKWDLVGYSGGSPGLENAVKRWGRPIGPIFFSVYFDASP